MPEIHYFQQLAQKQDVEINLAEAALQIAMDEYPNLDTASYLQQLFKWSSEVQQDCQDESATSKMKALHRLLFNQIHLSGNLDDYYDPKNSFLNEVIERKIGIPITLSVIYLDLAWRIGLSAEGIGFPGHFLVRVHLEDGPRYIDTFHDGNVMTHQECVAFWTRFTEGNAEFQDEFLSPLTKKQILVRMLRNLKRIYLDNKQFDKLLLILDKLIVLSPETPEEIRDRGIIYYHLESHRRALADFENFLSMAPQSEDAETIHQYVSVIREYLMRLN